MRRLRCAECIMQARQGFRCRPVGAVNRIAPAKPLAEIDEAFAARGVEAAIVIRIGFGATGDKRGPVSGSRNSVRPE